jgi:hypothetical protein
VSEVLQVPTTVAGGTGAWDDDDVLAHAESVALARTQSRALAARVAALPLPQARGFLRRLWEHAGTLDPAGAIAPSLLVEPALADDVTGLLARLGIASELTAVDGQALVTVPALQDRARFLREVALARVSESVYGACRADGHVPATVWQRVRQAVERRPIGAVRGAQP